MNAPELRRQYRAARTLANATRALETAERRASSASAYLTVHALAGRDATTVPGYRVWRDGATVHVAPVPTTDAAQLALWRAMGDDR